MDLNIGLNEKIGISEYIKAEMEIDAIIYRQEFEQHRTEYLRMKAEQDLIIAFIFLQIYIECFLHQNMRTIVELELKPPRDNVCFEWLSREKRYVPAKIDNFTFLFFSQESINIHKLVDCIKNRFCRLSDTRNQFVHGHKVSSWSDSDGNLGSTPTKLLLTEIQLAQSIMEVNELGLAWNGLLDLILPQCKALKRVNDFKLPNL
jgi:hypothetical protein